MKNSNSKSGFSLFHLILVMIVIVVGATALGTIARGAARGFAEGGGTLELFSDDITARNYGNGVAIAAKDSEVHVTNTVQQPEESPYRPGELLGLVIPFLMIAVIVAYIYSRAGSYDYI